MTRTGNHDSTPPPVITYPGILTSRTFDRTDWLDENFVISVAKTRPYNAPLQFAPLYERHGGHGLASGEITRSLGEGLLIDSRGGLIS